MWVEINNIITGWMMKLQWMCFGIFSGLFFLNLAFIGRFMHLAICPGNKRKLNPIISSVFGRSFIQRTLLVLFPSLVFNYESLLIRSNFRVCTLICLWTRLKSWSLKMADSSHQSLLLQWRFFTTHPSTSTISWNKWGKTCHRPAMTTWARVRQIVPTVTWKKKLPRFRSKLKRWSRTWAGSLPRSKVIISPFS